MTLQDFIEMYHPNYNCDDIAKFLDLDMYLSGEANKNAYIEGNPYTSYQEFIRIQDKIFKEAFENYSNNIVNLKNI